MIFKIIRQGKVRVNDVDIVIQNNDIVAIEIDLDSKYCDCIGYNDSIITLTANNDSLLLDETKEDFTEVKLFGFDGWKLFCSEESRYSIFLCLVRK